MSTQRHPLFTTKDVFQRSSSADGKCPGFPGDYNTQLDNPDAFSTVVSRHYNPMATQATMNAWVYQAVAALNRNDPNVGVLFLGEPDKPTSKVAAEVDDPDGGAIICLLDATQTPMTMRAARVTVTGELQPLPAIPARVTEVSPFPLLAMYLCMLHAETWDSAPTMEGLLEDAVHTLAEVAMFRLSHAVYSKFAKGNTMAEFHGRTIPTWRPTLPIEGAVEQKGVCRYLAGSDVSAVGNLHGAGIPRTFGEAKRYLATWKQEKEWTEEERELIPTFPDDYPLPEEAFKIIKRYVLSRKAKRPMNNFMWRGITSYGKSTGVEMIAALLDMPYVYMTCSSTMETQNFLSEFVPNNSPVNLDNLPTVEQMMLDPGAAWKVLTGEDKDATAEECLAEVVRKASASGDGPRFKLVESNFVKALARGYLCEIQEISRIRDSGVLVGLNGYDRPGAVLPLADGGYVRRDHNAMVVYTDNVGYVSCRPIDPSVLRRMSCIIDSFEMSRTTVMDRVRYNTGFEDEELLNTMYLVWKSIQRYCAEHEISEGEVSVSELEMWAMCVQMSTGDAAAAFETCLECVVSKATSVQAEQKEIMTACVDLTFGGA